MQSSGLHVNCCTDMKVTGFQIAGDIEAVQKVNCSIMAGRIVSRLIGRFQSGRSKTHVGDMLDI